MNGFNKVAIVNLLEDYNKKNYGFALYEEEYESILFLNKLGIEELLVVVNPREKNNRVLGIVKEIKAIENYGKNVTAQVVGVVNTTAYNERIEFEKKQKEIEKKKAAIENALNKEISKRKNLLEYYRKMAQEFSDNPELMKMVNELEELSAD